MIELQVVNVPILPRIISSFLIVTLVYITILQKAGVFTICLRGDMLRIDLCKEWMARANHSELFKDPLTYLRFRVVLF